MIRKDPRVDAYIEGVPEFAKPILTELRRRIHKHCPGVEETIRWGAPYFQYGGKLLGGMASFKRHAAFGFWHAEMRDGDTSLEGLGGFGHIESIADLPPDREFARLTRRAMQLVDDGVKPPLRPKKRRATIVVPAALTAALKRKAKARATFDGFSPSRQREYTDWIAEAKTAETRDRRVAEAIAWLAEGKPRYWKYQR